MLREQYCLNESARRAREGLVANMNIERIHLPPFQCCSLPIFDEFEAFCMAQLISNHVNAIRWDVNNAAIEQMTES